MKKRLENTSEISILCRHSDVAFWVNGVLRTNYLSIHTVSSKDIFELVRGRTAENEAIRTATLFDAVEPRKKDHPRQTSQILVYKFHVQV